MANGKRPCLTCFNRSVHVRSSKPLSRYLTLQDVRPDVRRGPEDERRGSRLAFLVA